MKVLFICPYNPFPPNSGNKTLTYNLIKALSNDINIDILIIEDDQEKSQSSKKSYIKKLVPLIKNIYFFKKNKNKFSIFGKLILILKGRHPSLSNYENKHLRRWLLVNSKNYNIIHFDTILTVNYLRFINTEISLLVASDAYSMATKRARIFTRGLYKNLRLILQEFCFKNIEVKLYPKFKKVITVSPIDAEYLKRISPKINIDNLPIPISDDFKETSIKHFQSVNTQPEKVRILFVGSLSHPIISSNIVSVIKLLRKSLLFSNNLEMVILGKDPHPIIKDILEKNITHIEYVEDYKKFLDQDWIYVYAQKCASGLQTKLQKAMAMGLPVIARPVSLGGLFPTHNKDILVAKSDSDFEKNVELLIKNPELRTYIGKNARSNILGNFSSEIVKKMYLNTYKKLLNIDFINSF